MIIPITKPLFAWDELEDSPALRTIRKILAILPDAKLLDALRDHRGRGRNDHPVEVLWGVVLLTVILRHHSYQACLEELRRNPGLQRLIGIEEESRVPHKWNISRFLDVLGREPFRGYVEEIFRTLTEKLVEAVPELGKDVAGDATWLHGRRKQDEEAAEEEASEGLPQPSGGRKEYRDDKGKVTEVVEWFGYQLHVLVDVKHEVALAYRVTSAHTADTQVLPELVKEAQGVLPEGRMKTLAYDRAADTEAVHEALHGAGIKPVIQNRNLWQEEPLRLLPGHDGSSNIVHDEAGTVYCCDGTSRPVVYHRMAYIGYEPKRGTIKYRCPARHEGWRCPHEEVCNAGKQYGKTVRVDCTTDLRRFPPIPRATKKFERLYKGRTAVERVIARLKVFWGVDDGNVTGSRRFVAQVGVVMAVHAAFAVLLASAPRRDGVLGQTRLGPVQQALRQSLRIPSGATSSTG